MHDPLFSSPGTFSRLVKYYKILLLRIVLLHCQIWIVILTGLLDIWYTTKQPLKVVMMKLILWYFGQISWNDRECVKDLTRGLTSNFAASFHIFRNFYQNYWNAVFKFAIAKTAVFQNIYQLVSVSLALYESSYSHINLTTFFFLMCCCQVKIWLNLSFEYIDHLFWWNIFFLLQSRQNDLPLSYFSPSYSKTCSLFPNHSGQHITINNSSFIHVDFTKIAPLSLDSRKCQHPK